MFPLQARQTKIVIGSGIAVLLAFYILIAPSSQFPTSTIVVVSQGASIASITADLQTAHIVRYAAVTRVLIALSGARGHVQAGAYLFVKPENAFSVVQRLLHGAYNIPPVRITFPEGMTVHDIARKVADALPLSADELLAQGKSDEGYLFPDTYLFSPSVTVSSVLETMRSNFTIKLASRAGAIRASGHSLQDIVTLASLVEKEARTLENRRLVAGVLWNRLARNMPLQVDAVFGYIFDRATYSPSFADLKVNSPYNTYLHTGLPPGPICNPGLESIDAVLNPSPSKYLYYLTDKQGVMHYATTYTDHQSNQEKYLQ